MHLRLLPALLLLLLHQTAALAGGVRGYVTDEDNEPLQYASIYVNETGQGAVTNEEGFFELRLEPGDYTLVFQFLGYQTEIKDVSIGERFRDLDVQLLPQAFDLQQVDVLASGEDPAYTVMRRAIAKAEYHRQQLDSYSARVYVKGSGRLLDSPFFLRNRIEKEGIDSTVAFTSESVSIVEYERPNTYRERVISVYSTGEDNSTSPMQYINGSFYEEELGGAISPLSPKAFAYYKFKLVNYFADRGYMVNKIKVTPRSRGDGVFEGFIYILQDYWSIHSLDLTTYQIGIKFDINQLYTPVEEDVWMPIRATFNVTGSLLGLDFEYNYLATLSDYEIELNPDLPSELEVIDEKIDREIAKELERARKEDPEKAETIEKLNEGEELTRKELRQMMREYEKEEQKEQEAPEIVEDYTYEVDSNAYEKDSAFWAEARPLPLTEYEVKGYELQDSIATAEREEAEEGDDTDSVGRGNLGVSGLLFGRSFSLGEGHSLQYRSPLLSVQYNPVEGYNGTGGLTYRYRGDNDLDAGIDGRYGLAWNRFNFRGFSSYRFGQRDEHVLSVEGGRYVSQYNVEYPVVELFNTFYALLFERNYIHLFEKEYGALNYRKDWSETATLRFGAEWANRRTLRTFTNQTWFPRDDQAFPDNVPFNLEAETPFPERRKAFVLQAGIEVRPWQKYRIRNDNRYAIENSSPTLGLKYRKGINGLAESTTNFDLLEFTYQQKITPGVRGILDLRLNTGIFLNNNSLGFADFKHFPGNQMVFTTSDPVASYRLLPYYTFSTQEEFVSAHVHYQFRKFLFTRIWQVQLLGIKENAFVNYLHTPTSEHYFEVGYGIDNIFRLFRLEFVTSFQDGAYEDFGVRIGIASNIGGMLGIE